MASERTVVGILSPEPETRKFVSAQLQATGFSCSVVEGDRYCLDRDGRPTRQLVEAQPQIVLVDLRDQDAGIRALQVLHAELPQSWLFVCSPKEDPQLIIDAMREGAREFFPTPVPLPSLTQALERYSAERQLVSEKRERGKIYCITAAKEGTGATTVAINLAAAAAMAADAKVALIDLNSPVGDAAEYLNLRPQYNLSDALESVSRLDPTLLESYMSHNQSLAVLPGSKETRISKEDLAALLRVVGQTYTHAFLDFAGHMRPEQVQVVVEASAAVLLIVTPELPALWRADRLLRILENAGGQDKLKIVLNRYDKRQEITEREIKRTLNYSVSWTLPNNYPVSIQAINSGKPLVTENHSSLAATYMDFADELTGLPLRKKRRSFGLFS